MTETGPAKDKDSFLPKNSPTGPILLVPIFQPTLLWSKQHPVLKRIVSSELVTGQAASAQGPLQNRQ